jgi:hypothetical protein
LIVGIAAFTLIGAQGPGIATGAWDNSTRKRKSRHSPVAGK